VSGKDSEGQTEKREKEREKKRENERERDPTRSLTLPHPFPLGGLDEKIEGRGSQRSLRRQGSPSVRKNTKEGGGRIKQNRSM